MKEPGSDCGPPSTQQKGINKAVNYGISRSTCIQVKIRATIMRQQCILVQVIMMLQ